MAHFPARSRKIDKALFFYEDSSVLLDFCQSQIDTQPYGLLNRLGLFFDDVFRRGLDPPVLLASLLRRIGLDGPDFAVPLRTEAGGLRFELPHQGLFNRIR